MHIVFTGGGTAGHVMPNLPLIKRFQERGWRVSYIGSGAQMERKLLSSSEVDYRVVCTGKLRRYLTFKNILDAVKVFIGIVQAFWLVRRLRPDIVFSKGGFVAVPVVLGSWLNRVPVVVHESDLSSGLANKISYPVARKICVTFLETAKHLPEHKTVCTGALVRAEIACGNAPAGRDFCGFSEEKPILLVMGGSQGAAKINETVGAALPELLRSFQLVHLCGAGNLVAAYDGLAGYRQFEFLGAPLFNVLAAADLAISRAGSNSLLELLVLRLPHLLVPLGTTGSRGDQLENAAMAEQNGWSLVLQEEDLSVDSLVSRVQQLQLERLQRQQAMASFQAQDAVVAIEGVLNEVLGI